ncbi:DNA polymerase IV [Serinicoccus chungangensis]|uniref:DNA polymerase IV n=1 Tax=Serinicoccus chungangensis TaxID=767452 RepID=A0A0W8I6X1_9MICO|nr:DNA polymerase IV [Serinicoccus chungangensis]KUG53753.1 DNA polymerase IV [Serinicoccus chungangensis]
MSRRWVLHVDLDQFLAAVEVLRRPELAGRPVVVGGRGDPTERAVVSTASYEAREHGVRSGMPLRVAAQRCPGAVFLPLDLPAYEDASEQVMSVLRGWPDAVVQVLGWDEAFVGIRAEDPQEVARGLQAAVLRETGLHCSVGIGDTLVRAKTATDLGKPRGTAVLTRETWPEVMGPRPTGALWGVGRRIETRLAGLGITTVAELAHADDATLGREFGPTNGPRLSRLARGEGPDRPDDTPWVPRARGRETTYQEDLLTPQQVRDALGTLAERVAEDVRGEGRPVRRVHLKVRFAPFSTVHRSHVLAAPTTDAEVVAGEAFALYRRLQDHRPVRLLGVRGEMVPPADGS